MTKNKKKMSALVLATMAAAAVGLTGCGSEFITLDSYTGDIHDKDGVTEYNHALFYRNSWSEIGPDPFIFDDTEKSGYYYAYSTKEFFFINRSTDLVHWEAVDSALRYFGNPDMSALIDSDIWAPEVLFDEDLGKYILYFSATAKFDNNKKINNDCLLAAVSDSPVGPFEILDFFDADSVGAENVHEFDQSIWSEYNARYLFLNPQEFYNLYKRDVIAYTNGADTPWMGDNIDPHPFVASDGTKFMYWATSGYLFGVEMENWLKPKWNTATMISASYYYTVEDFRKGASGDPSVELVDYEDDTIGINEGPTVLEHNNKYYMTCSVNGYGAKDYQVVQMISDNPLGPFRKLTVDEGGILLSGAMQGSRESSGTGHHSFVNSGGRTYIFYHRHNTFEPADGGPRHSLIDEIKWITVKDKFGNPMEIMYANGPSTTVQPMIAGHTDYVNIAQYASVTGGKLDSGSSLKWLHDELLSHYKTHVDAFDEFVQETKITETSTFTFEFDSAKSIRAVLVYNSKSVDSMFMNIPKIEIVGEKNGKAVNYIIQNVKFDSFNYTEQEGPDGMYVDFIKPCSAAFAEFDEVKAKTVSVTVEVPKGKTVGISEIMILGRAD